MLEHPDRTLFDPSHVAANLDADSAAPTPPTPFTERLAEGGLPG